MAAPPRFLRPLPAETDATDGDIVTFQVQVSGEDPASVSWWRCGEPLRPIPGRREMVRHGEGWHELVLTNITEDDEGEYECRAENSRGHNSCFGSLYYYREGGGGGAATLTDVAADGDGRQSGLLILIDDGSQTEESGSERSNRKSMTVSEQMQGIIEDLTQSSQGEDTGSMTLEKGDEDQFNSDAEELDDDDDLMKNIRGMAGGQQRTASEDTLVPEMPSPDPPACVALSEGASDPYARPSRPTHRWRSNPNHVPQKKKKKKTATNEEEEEESVWPPEAAAPDTSTTSVELPFARGTTSTEALKSSGGFLAGAETPFDVADITEEAVDPASPADGTTTGERPKCVGLEVLMDSPAIATRVDSSLTSVTDLLSGTAATAASECCQQPGNEMSSFARSSVKSSSTYKQHAEDSSFVDSHTKVSRRTEEGEEEESFSKRTKLGTSSAAYEADESSGSFTTDRPTTIHRKGFDVYVAIMNFRPMESDEGAVNMREGQTVEVLDASKPRRWKVRVLEDEEGGGRPREGWVPACYLERRRSTIYEAMELGHVLSESDLDPRELEAVQNRESIVRELLETEEDFAKDLQFVVENYYRRMEDPGLPKELKDRKGSVFGNFKDIADFHNNVLMEGIHYHAKEPTKLGKTFLRLERDFDMHANYCWNEARAQQLLREGPLKEYFDEHSRKIEDDKLLSDHLKLPIQRLNDYQLLIKELIKYSSRLNEDTSDLQKALDFIHGINKRTRDLQCVQAIQGCRGDLLKIGKIVRHEVLDVVDGERTSERHVFLFKGRLFVAEKGSDSSGKDAYHVTHLLKLQDVEVAEKEEADPLAIRFRPLKKGSPLTLRARSPEQKEQWCRDILASAAHAVEDLGDLEPRIDVPQLKHKAAEEERRESKKPRVEDSPPREKNPPQNSGDDRKSPESVEKKESSSGEEEERRKGEESLPEDPNEEKPLRTPLPERPTPSVPLCHLLTLVPLLFCAFYVVAQIAGAELWR